jgi:hypothetical protein
LVNPGRIIVESRTVQKLTQALVFLVTFIFPLMLRKRDVATGSLDAQNFLKFGVWAVCFAFAMWFIRRWGYRLLSIETASFFLLLVLMTLSATYAPSPVYTIGSVLSIVSTLVIFLMAGDLIGERKVLVTFFSAVVILSFFSIIMDPPPLSRWAYLGLAIVVLTLIMSNSRTSIAAAGLAIAIVHFSRLTYLNLIMVLVGGCAVMFFVAVIDPQKLFSLLSRTGDASEITTGTGRSHIWHAVIDLIQQRPLTGWGYASSNYILPAFSEDIGHPAPHAHNAFLQIMFSNGVIGLLLYVIFMVMMLVFCLISRDRMKLCMFLFILFTSLTESSFFAPAPTVAVLPLAVLLSMHYRHRVPWKPEWHKPFAKKLQAVRLRQFRGRA